MSDNDLKLYVGISRLFEDGEYDKACAFIEMLELDYDEVLSVVLARIGLRFLNKLQKSGVNEKILQREINPSK